MVNSVYGQNDPWAAIGAGQTASASQSGQGCGASSSGVDFQQMMMLLRDQSQSASQTDPATGEADAASATADSSNTETSSIGGDLSSDLQSFLASLTGGTQTTTASSASATDASTTAANGGTIDLQDTLLQDLNAIAAALSSMASGAGASAASPTSTASQTSAESETSTASPIQSADGSAITNSGTAAATQNWPNAWDATTGPGDAWRQQAVTAAYTANFMSALTGSGASAASTISA